MTERSTAAHPPSTSGGEGNRSDTDERTLTRSPLVLRLQGEVDLTHRAQLQTYYETYVASAARDVEVDLADVTFMDASGLSLLARLSVLASQRGGSVRVVDPCPAVVRVLQVTGLDGELALEGRRRGPVAVPSRRAPVDLRDRSATAVRGGAGIS